MDKSVCETEDPSLVWNRWQISEFNCAQAIDEIILRWMRYGRREIRRVCQNKLLYTLRRRDTGVAAPGVEFSPRKWSLQWTRPIRRSNARGVSNPVENELVRANACAEAASQLGLPRATGRRLLRSIAEILLSLA